MIRQPLSSGAPAARQNVASFSAVMPTPFGAIGITTAGAFINEIVFLPPGVATKSADTLQAEMACNQIQRYLADAGFAFTLPLVSRGSPFRRCVWAAIAAIPIGQTSTYGAIAKALQSVPRAVGQACGDNPFPLVIPCHRVVSASGLGGFAHENDGHLINTKRWLLHHEGAL